MNSDIMVSVCISTFNHENFIEDALSSVLMQECDFEYEIILSNDFSNDHTHEVIEKYIVNHPNGFRIRYFNQEENLGFNKNLVFTLEQTEGKYIALLEGDDYWLDQRKLQKQFDFMEQNPDYSVCTAGYQSIIPEEGLVTRTENGVPGVTYEFENLTLFRAHLVTMFFRKDALDIDKLKKFEYSGDNVIFIMCLVKGKGYFNSEILGFRRTHPNGLWTSKSAVERLKFGSLQYIGLHQFPEFRKITKPVLFHTYVDLSTKENKKSHLFHALRYVSTSKEFFYFGKVLIKSLFP